MTELNEPLSEREVEILRLLASGLSNKEIASTLVISPNTVKVHLRNIFAKIGVVSRTEATLYAIRAGLVDAMPAAALGAAAEEVEPEPAPLPIAEMAPQPPLAPPTQRARRWPLAVAGAALLLTLAGGIAWFARPTPPAATPTLAAPVAIPTLADRWQTSAALPAARMGIASASYEGNLYIFGGEDASGAHGETFRLNLITGEWKSGGEKPTPVSYAQAALLGEKIYCPGGKIASGAPSDVFEVYDPRRDTWETRAPLPTPLYGYALATAEGRLFLFGGWNGQTASKQVYEYQPDQDRWQERTPLTSPRAFAAAAVIEERVYLSGGWDGERQLDLFQRYSPARDDSGEAAWEDLPPLPAPRAHHGAASLAGALFVVGGALTDANPPLVFTPQTDAWQIFENPLLPIGADAGTLAAGNFLHILGGELPGGLTANHQTYQAIYTINLPFLQGQNE